MRMMWAEACMSETWGLAYLQNISEGLVINYREKGWGASKVLPLQNEGQEKEKF